ncbi:MAG: ATP-binding cassette domain-containing protein [Jatrophihabitans sp.]|uniref:ATP-binding cassette domain-containing protein n=1 Tax=Jatrophihabitans sp. TaxID=1932789 RepID=UPI003F7E650C
MTAPLLEVEAVGLEVRLRRRALPVLHEVTFTASAGQRVALSGRSGSGKSSLCALLAGFRPPTSGRVRIDGVDADRIGDWSLVSYLPQHAALDPVLTVGENVAVATVGTSASPEPADDLLERLGLGRLIDRRADQLSAGERQRAALARTLLGGRRLVVLDEPTSAQDAGHLSLVLDAVDRAAAAGTCVVVSTHDARVLRRCDLVVPLADGTVRAVA